MADYVFENGVFRRVSRLATALCLGMTDKVVSFVGSGGKSTLIMALAKEAVSQGKTVVISTTTHIMRNDYYIEDKDEALGRLPERRLVTLAGPGPDGKLASPGAEYIKLASGLADLVLIEADGSKQLPLKYPATYEPVIDQLTDCMVLVMGLSALGQPLEEVCHRVHLAEKYVGINSKAKVQEDDLVRLLCKGYLEPSSDSPYTVHLALNQADTKAQLEKAAKIAKKTITCDSIENTAISVSAHRVDIHQRQ